MFSIKEIQKDQWTWNGATRTLENPKIGRITIYQVYKDDGTTPAYQQPVWTEVRGEINIVLDDQARIAFVEQNRHVIIPADLYKEEWTRETFDPLKYQMGVTQLELPRGLTKEILGEVREEVRFDPGEIEATFRVNGNTALFSTSPFVYVTKVTKRPSTVPVDPTEKITKVVWIEPYKVREISTLCGFTMSALWLFRNWCLGQQMGFWKQIGKAL